MNARKPHNEFAPASPSPAGVGATQIVGAAATPLSAVPAYPNFVLIADASKVSGREFLDALTGDTPAKREHRREIDRQRCIRAIQRGDTYGFPPVMVEECRKLMAEEPEGWALAERSAFGMPGVKA